MASEGIIYQWDKACDAMPILRPLVMTALSALIVYVVMFFLPSRIIPYNEGRPPPNSAHVYDSLSDEYVYAETNRNPENTFRKEEQRGRLSQSQLTGVSYSWEVSELVENPDGLYTLKSITRLFVDRRDLRKVKQSYQVLSVRSDVTGYKDMIEGEVLVELQRDVVSRCPYYVLKLFGKARIIHGGARYVEAGTNCDYLCCSRALSSSSTTLAGVCC